LRLALFDFDGTLSTADSMPAFLRHNLSAGMLTKGLFRWVISCAKLLVTGEFSRDSAKSALLFACLKSQTPEALATSAAAFADQWLPQHLNPHTQARLQAHRAEGDRVVVVSAAPDIWMHAICQALGVECICTEMARDAAGYLQPTFKGRNCRGAEKVNRIRAVFSLNDFEEIIAYGNSSGDREMLELAHEAWFCKKNGQLIRLK